MNRQDAKLAKGEKHGEASDLLNHHELGMCLHEDCSFREGSVVKNQGNTGWVTYSRGSFFPVLSVFSLALFVAFAVQILTCLKAGGAMACRSSSGLVAGPGPTKLAYFRQSHQHCSCGRGRPSGEKGEEVKCEE